MNISLQRSEENNNVLKTEIVSLQQECFEARLHNTSSSANVSEADAESRGMIQQLIEANKVLSAKIYSLSEDNGNLASNLVFIRTQVDQLS